MVLVEDQAFFIENKRTFCVHLSWQPACMLPAVGSQVRRPCHQATRLPDSKPSPPALKAYPDALDAAAVLFFHYKKRLSVSYLFAGGRQVAELFQQPASYCVAVF